MNRFLLSLLALVAGCADFRDIYYYQGADEAVMAAPSCGCQAPGQQPLPTVSALPPQSGRAPVISQLSGEQTREPELFPRPATR